MGESFSSFRIFALNRVFSVWLFNRFFGISVSVLLYLKCIGFIY